MAHDESDEDLLRRAVAGDADAFGTIVSRHENRIFSLAYRMLGERQDALDATQDAFIAAFKQAKKFRGDSSFATWLYRIGINASTDLLRKRKRWMPNEEVDRADLATGPEDQAVARVDVQRALAQLPAEYREAVIMHDLGGIPYDEIARLTSAQLGTVKSRISRGRKRLGEMLEQAGAAKPSNLRR